MSRKNRISKPNYGFTKQQLWVSFVLSWTMMISIIVAALVFNAPQAKDIAIIAFPVFGLIVTGGVAFHRHYGSRDMQIQAEAEAAKPEGEGE